jgi:hypothetical protein
MYHSGRWFHLGFGWCVTVFRLMKR